ncbi:MAG TPA: RIP metalloprotease RseP [Oceanospirillales bacterium]|nr:RIP metalloprotease RseP [Oceanospirillales bacterium]
MLDFISSIWWMLVTLGILVTFHEYGHFWMARKFGVKVLKFSVGYGKLFWSKKDKLGTEFGFAPIPLGGYVKLLDTRDPDYDKNRVEDENLTYNSKPIWQRALIMFAGPAFNFILAVLLFWMMFIYGKDEMHPVVDKPEKILLQAGVQYKDRILSINNYPTNTWQDVTLELITNGLDHKDIEMTVQHENGSKQQLTLKLSELSKDIDEKQIFDEIGLKSWKLPLSNVVGEVPAGKPAALAGVKVGDKIIAVNGDTTNDWHDVVEKLQKHIDTEINLTILRNNNTLNVTIPDAIESTDGKRRIIGIGASQPEAKDVDYYKEKIIFSHSYGFVQAFGQAFKETWRMTTVSLEMMGKIITGKASLKNLSGPITIAQVANYSAERGVAWFLGFLGLVSLSLGIINLIPIPMLDGGQLLFLLFEKIKGSPLSEELQLKGQTVGIIFLLCFMSIAFYNDILRLIS